MPVENKARVDTTWEEFWAAGVEVGDYFDAKHALPELVHQLKASAFPRGSRALIPGCGRGYAVEALCQSGLYDTVIGLDMAPTAVAAANAYLSSRDLSGEYAVVAGDFFDDGAIAKPFDLVYDYTFFCAIPVEWRPKWAQRMSELVRVGGVLVTVMFPMGRAREEGGPPHGVSEEDYIELLEGSGGFRRKDGPRRLPDERTHEGRGGGQTYWCVWERVDDN